MKPMVVQDAPGLLARFNEAGVLGPADVHVASRLARATKESDERVALACALAVRALRAGSVCVRLATVAQEGFELDEASLDVSTLPWPEPEGWTAALAASPMVALGAGAPDTRPLRFVDGLLYLERYWGHEEGVRVELQNRRSVRPEIDEQALATALDRHFPPGSADTDARQRAAAESAVRHQVTVVAGGPGTGKTTTVARLLAVLAAQTPHSLRIALAAPTGKAAVRLEESVRYHVSRLGEPTATTLGGLTASTLHKLLGYRRDNPTRFVHDADNPLPHDVVVVDEASMVSVHMMDRLLEAVRPTARLVLVGDPDQLSSVEAGAVLADVVGAADTRGVVRLERNWRFGGDITDLATAIRDGDAAAASAVLARGSDAVQHAEADLSHGSQLDFLRQRVVASHRAAWAAAGSGDAMRALHHLDEHRLLCAHNSGPYGVGPWQWQVERWLTEEIPGYRRGDDDFHVGRPVIIGRNLPEVELSNGDTGIVVETPDGPRVAFARGAAPVLFSPTQLADVSTLYAMTIHKSQGSQYEHVTVLVPPVGSPLLRRELLYTAVTRARTSVTLVGSTEAIVEAIRTPARRASGLRERL